MRLVQYPAKKQWDKLVARPVNSTKQINKLVKPLLKQVRKKGDEALFKLTSKFDKVNLESFEVSSEEIKEAVTLVDDKLKEAIQIASRNIRKFHEAQLVTEQPIETTKGVKCWRKSVGIEKVGLYVPGGTAPLFSTVLMLAIPATIAGCKEIILCSPPNNEGKLHPAILYAANLSGVTKIFKVGGAQAIAAMAFGTESIPKVSKVFGPGNQFVTAAKQLVNSKGTAIDMPAGPSEVAVIADDSANPDFVAADLIAQAEHGADSQSHLFTNSMALAQKVQNAVEKQLLNLPRKNVAEVSLNNSSIFVFNTLDEIMEFSNLYAPEHLIIATKNYNTLLDKVVNAGSVFVGHYTPESLGDYISGTNHTLPTNGFAKAYSGVSIDSFIKKITFQEATKEGLQNLGSHTETMAAAEELIGHKLAVTYRLQSFSK